MLGQDDDLAQPLDPGAGTVSPVNWFSSQGYQPNASTRVTPMVGGEVAFERLGHALRAARHSICMAFWGMDPGFLFNRGTFETHDKTRTLAEILMDRAADGVTVRVVVWHNTYAGSLSGLGATSGSAASQGTDMTDELGGNNRNLIRFMAAAELTPNLDVVLTPAFSATPQFGSFHQKIVTIDVEDPAIATAFVMGHNLMLAYWSTTALVPVQPRREFYLELAERGRPQMMNDYERNLRSYNQSQATPYRTPTDDFILEQARQRLANVTEEIDGLNGLNFNYTPHRAPGIGPLFDISSQIWGQCVGDVYHNFDRLWRMNGKTLRPTPAELGNMQSNWGDSNPLTQAQVGATFKGGGYTETAIEDFYFNAFRNANRYILMVNQYFRYWDLTERIIEMWRSRGVPGQKKIPIYVVTNTFDDSFKERGHDGETLKLFEDAGIPVSLCRMATKENINRRDVYVHAKLLIVDDVFFTIGSANYNFRSLQGDPEFNVAVVDPSEALALRRQVMNVLIGQGFDNINAGGGDHLAAFDDWNQLVARNTTAYGAGQVLPFGRTIQYAPRTDNIPFTNQIVMNETPAEESNLG